MDIIQKLQELKLWFEENSLHCFCYKLIIEDCEIKLEMGVSLGWDFVFNEYKNFNACDFKTNLESIVSYLNGFQYEKYRYGSTVSH